MNTIRLHAANLIITAALEKAIQLHLNPLAVAVLDAGGQLVAFQRQDGASPGRLQISVGKAAGALFFGFSSRKIAAVAADRPAFMASVTPLAPNGLVAAAGGVIIEGDGGIPLGAVGISGDSSDNDEMCALAGLEAAGLSARS